METLLNIVWIIIKVFVSLMLLGVLIHGVIRAHPKSHHYSAAAEYGAGFIGVFLSSLGFYYLWW